MNWCFVSDHASSIHKDLWRSTIVCARDSRRGIKESIKTQGKELERSCEWISTRGLGVCITMTVTVTNTITGTLTGWCIGNNDSDRLMWQWQVDVSVEVAVKVLVVVTSWVYTCILGREDEASKGGRSLLPIGVREHRELYIPLGWSLYIRGS